MKNITTASAAALAIATVFAVTPAEARDTIQIVGSSTVFPFTTAVAERFGQQTTFTTPVVESTGTGGGMKLFCEGVGPETPDFTNASRRIKASELAECAANGVTPVEIRVGFDGIVVANSVEGPEVNLTRGQLFLALAAQVPGADGALVANPYANWSDIDASLPNEPIEVLGPPPTSGTRDAFLELVMEPGCEEAGVADDVCKDIFKAIREDGAYVEAGENDNLIVQKLEANPASFGIFGYSYLEENSAVIQGAMIDGVEPTFEAIASAEYPVSRSLYIYAKAEHVGVIPGMAEFIEEYTSEGAWGDDGYLVEKGLIPLPAADRETVGAAARTLTGVQL
ncbi:MAG: PstS family phosphate ABC transporter substrate-binding protein [Hyphomicrobiaceae bacterium]|nr:PstS family phosphate ABC transporter substrate-binding protein [Hyphomicrobiaceae bacterium]